jgi:hypothetical protein
MEQAQLSEKFTNHSKVKRALKRLKHAAALIDCFTEYGTPRPVLETAKVVATSAQVRSVREYVLGTDANLAVDGLAPLAQKFLFAKWLNTSEMLGQETHPEAVLIDRAMFVFQADITKLSAADQQRIRDMRTFLLETLRKENPEATTNQDALTIYKLNRQHLVLPEGLLDYSRLFLGDQTQKERIQFIRPREYYSDERRKSIDWAGRKFIEASLLSPRTGPPSIEQLLINTSQTLKDIKAQSLRP